MPVAYGLGYVAGLLVAWVNSFRRETTLSHEARELPMLLGLAAAMGYIALLARGLLSVP
ncbi:MAG: hypothetical protein QOI91_1102 [Solirubrobacteraceae bacterium]|nr:hypothetical protein [Solirubrobacteraceae bacterium]